MTTPRALFIEMALDHSIVTSANKKRDRMHQSAINAKVRQAGRQFASARLNVPRLTRAVVWVEVRRPKNSHGDAANLHPTVKALTDGALVDSGLLPDDSDKYLRGPFIIPSDEHPRMPGRWEFTVYIFPARSFHPTFRTRKALEILTSALADLDVGGGE